METTIENTAGSDCQERLLGQISQDGYAIVATRPAALPLTLGFELTTWEAERSLKALRSEAGDEFGREIHIVRATLKFSLPNRQLERLKA